MTLVDTSTSTASALPVDGPHAVRRAELPESVRAEMYALLTQHFEGVTPAQFAHDLAEKDWVLTIRIEGRLVGFTTLQVLHATHDARPIHVLYSGDTIMAPEAWGSPVLARGWIALVHRIRAEHAAAPWYWLLLSSGYRTYRFLPVFWREFWPRHDTVPPAGVLQLRDQLATQRFGRLYDAVAGVVRFEHPQRLRGALAAVPEGKELDPHVRFFLAVNPGHAVGDELVCLTELGDANLTAAGERMVRAGRRAALGHREPE
jgi:hypothetical protein